MLADAFGTMIGALTGNLHGDQLYPSAAGVGRRRAHRPRQCGGVTGFFVVAMFCAPLVAPSPGIRYGARADPGWRAHVRRGRWRTLGRLRRGVSRFPNPGRHPLLTFSIATGLSPRHALLHLY